MYHITFVFLYPVLINALFLPLLFTCRVVLIVDITNFYKIRLISYPISDNLYDNRNFKGYSLNSILKIVRDVK